MEWKNKKFNGRDAYTSQGIAQGSNIDNFGVSDSFFFVYNITINNGLIRI